MKTNYAFIITVLFFLASCTNYDKLVDRNFDGEPNYYNVYRVDTISIENPILLNYGTSDFVMSKNVLYQQKKITADFFTRPDVFLFHFSILNDFSSKDLKNRVFKDKQGAEVTDFTKYKNYYVREFKCDSIRFILCLINVNFYNREFNSLSLYYRIRQPNQKAIYFKLVYPLCIK